MVTAFDAILNDLEPLSARFHDAGHELHLVGGVVRDKLLGLPHPVDVDLATSARPTEVRAILSALTATLWTQGERFGTIGARYQGYDIEVTTYRAESYDSLSRNPTVAFGDSLIGDLERRDFTINAMAVSTSDGRLRDPFGGQADLQAQLLRTPLDPGVSFSDDPLRILRAARFLPRFGLQADPALGAAARSVASRLAIVSVERIREEWERLLALEAPLEGLDFLRRFGLLSFIGGRSFGEPGSAPPAWSEPLMLATAEGCRTHPDQVSLLRRMTFLSCLAASEASEELSRLRYATRVRQQTEAVRQVRDGVAGWDRTDEGVRRVVASGGPDAEPIIIDLGLEAAMAAGDGSDLRQALDRLRSTEDLGDLGSPLSGGEIMSQLGIDPGPEVGEVTRWLVEQRLRQGPIDPAAARSLLAQSRFAS